MIPSFTVIDDPRPHDRGLTQEDIAELLSIGAALAAERDLGALLTRILEQSRKILRADAGTLFLAEGPSRYEHPNQLRFILAQNDSVEVDLKEFSLPIDPTSLVGYVAKTGKPLRIDDAYHIPSDLPFRFNPEFDRKTGYRSMSLLSVAMTDHQEQLIGVVQLWNKKRDRSDRVSASNAAEVVLPFLESDIRLLSSLAAQAGVAIENAMLYSDIERLMEGFIRASVKAIESRDPTTSGHSERVATLTLGIAEVVNGIHTGPLSSLKFSKDELKQLRYAALLHDFGKIGVRERVLIKAKKLYPGELKGILEKLELLHRNIELDISQRKLNHLIAGGKPGDLPWLEIERDLEMRLAEIQSSMNVVIGSNEPTVLAEKLKNDLTRLSKLVVPRLSGAIEPLVSPEQMMLLSIPKGSLSDSERREIETHVSNTFEYLREIPWTRDLRSVADIAHAHHEKLDGSGYPRGLRANDIPYPARAMAIADIFDALAARDRPYKRAVPVDKALDILLAESARGQLDADLARIFVDAKVYELIQKT